MKRINKFMNGEELDPNNVQHEESESMYLIKLKLFVTIKSSLFCNSQRIHW